MLKTLSIIGYFGMVAGLVGLVVLRSVFSPSPFAIAAQVAAAMLLIWARITFGWRSYHVVANPTEGGLVTSGPYRYLRHPIYSAICVFTAAAVAAHWSWATAACGVFVFGCTVLRIYCEETLVAARYPEYRHYATTTWRMIPYVY